MSVEDGIPAEGQATPPHDWERDYKALQAEYTRSQQALKEHESAWEDKDTALARLAEKHPELFESEDETPEYEEPPSTEYTEPQPDPRVDWLAAREAERQYETDLKRFVGDREIDDEGKEWVEARSRHLAERSGKQWGPEHLEKAVTDFYGFVEKVRGPQRREAPTPPQPGTAGEKKRDPRSREERRAAMAAAIAAEQQ